AGKTNLLEAVSFLSPGRGLRRATLAEVTRIGAPDGFAIHADVEGPYGTRRIGTGTAGAAGEGSEPMRRVRIDGENARSAEAMLDWLRVIWLTPAMDALFTGPAGDRRRFLDRLVLAIDPAQGRRAADYEKAMRARNRLLAEESRDTRGFEAMDTQMAEAGTAIAAARAELVRLLAGMIGKLPGDSPFPRSVIALSGTIEEQVGQQPAVEIEERFRVALAEGRFRDRA